MGCQVTLATQRLFKSSEGLPKMVSTPKSDELAAAVSSKPVTNVLVLDDPFGVMDEDTDDYIKAFAVLITAMLGAKEIAWDEQPDEMHDGKLCWWALHRIPAKLRKAHGDEAVLELTFDDSVPGKLTLSLGMLIEMRHRQYECTIPDTGVRDPHVLYNAMIDPLRAAVSIFTKHPDSNGGLYSSEDPKDWAFAMAALALANRGQGSIEKLKVSLPSPFTSAYAANGRGEQLALPPKAINHINANAPSTVALILRDHDPFHLVMTPAEFGMEAFDLLEATPMDVLRLLAASQANATLPENI
jgi:hypothetical protein